MKHVVITGGLGYIGRHVVSVLKHSAVKVVIIDDLSNSDKTSLPSEVDFFEGDYANEDIWNQICSKYRIETVIHLAASVNSAESMIKPELYFENNTNKVKKLLEIILQHGISKIIFSSTAAVYGSADKIPVDENQQLHPTNPYGESKMQAEDLIKLCTEQTKLTAIVFRFFNAAGTNSGVNFLPKSKSTLLSQLKSVLDNQLPRLTVYGDKFSTKDGTCVRDFVHVDDIAQACNLAMQKQDQLPSYIVYNIGSGTGFTIQAIIEMAAKLFNKEIPVYYDKPRQGEIIVSVASNAKIKQQLGLKFENSELENILKTSLG